MYELFATGWHVIQTGCELCATGCNSKDLGHGAGDGIAYIIKSPALSDVCSLGRQ